MKAISIVSALCGLQFIPQTSAFAIPTADTTPAPLTNSTNFFNNVVFTPLPGHESWGTIYARTVQLPDGSHLLSWEDYSPEPPLLAFPVWRSEDGGLTWSNYSQIKDQVNGWGNRYQPQFFVLPQALGDYPAGTIVFAGMSVRKDLAHAWLDVYASTDNGANWEFTSHAVYAPGPETVKNGDKAVWEPFFVFYEGELVMHYSDQRDPQYAQKLSHITTTNLKDWSDPVDDVTYPDYGWRPGMTTVAHIESTGKYIMTYEICDGPGSGCPAYYKVADSPLDFNSVEGLRLRTTEGQEPGSAPYIIWTPHSARDDGSGVLIMNGGSSRALFINEDDASPDGWKVFDIEQESAHSRTLEIVTVGGAKKLMVAGGGHMRGGADNKVKIGVMDIPHF